MAREQRLVFGEIADDYDRIRPGYPDPVLDVLVARSPGRRFVEVGAGTGLATIELLRRGCTVIAVEPSAAMADVLRRRLVAPTPDHADAPGQAQDEQQGREQGEEQGPVTVVTAGFETWAASAEPGQADVVAAFQAWHWIDPAGGFAGAGRVLAPGGLLALCWNHPDPIDPALRSAIDAVYRREAPGFEVREPGAKGRDVDRAGGPLRTIAPAWFGEVDVVEQRWVATYGPADYATLLGTQSDHRLLPDEVRSRLLDGVADVVAAAGGRIELPFTTRLVLTHRHG